jgi:hypothetical protein
MTAVPTAGEEREGPVSFVYDIASHADSGYDSASVLIRIENQSSFAGRRSPFAYFTTFLAAEKTAGKTIGLGLDADLANLQGSGAIICLRSRSARLTVALFLPAKNKSRRSATFSPWPKT